MLLLLVPTLRRGDAYFDALRPPAQADAERRRVRSNAEHWNEEMMLLLTYFHLLLLVAIQFGR